MPSERFMNFLGVGSLCIAVLAITAVAIQSLALMAVAGAVAIFLGLLVLFKG